MNSERIYECDIYPKRDILLTKGKNAQVWDQNGTKYIDCVAGHGVASVGHCNKKIIEAIINQAHKLITCPGIFYNDTRGLLMEKLIKISPQNLKQVFFCNSGAETIEAAIKFARFTTGKREFICTFKGFHGRTMGALSASFNPKNRASFEPLVPGFIFVAFNRFEQIRRKTTKDTAAIILEIIQGEGGVHVGSQAYFKKVSQWCRDNKILLIIDEVQTGFCRTGKMFASELFDLRPDILCVAKALAGGLPMGAVICSESIKPPKGQHGSTFGGNPLACAAAIAAIDFMIDNNLADQAYQKGQYLMDRVKSSPINIIEEIRGLGLMIGIELSERVKPYILKLAGNGILTLPAGKKVLRLLPPLTIGYQELDVVVEKIIQVLNKKNPF